MNEYWHFLRDDGRLNYLPHTRVKQGMTLRAEGPLVICKNGMHASIRPIDALKYAPGSLVCRVTLEGEILANTDKVCARTRTVLWMADATRTLYEFAVWCAERALQRERDQGREPNSDSWAALDIKRQWLRGEASDDELDDATTAASAAARTAAETAARTAASAAARAAAWAAAMDAQNAELERRLLLLAPMEKITHE